MSVVLYPDSLAGEHLLSGIKYTEDAQNIPISFKLFQNYPNPFNPETNIKYMIPNPSNVKITIYDLLGKPVAILYNKN